MMNHTEHGRRRPLRIVLLLILHVRSIESFCTSPIYATSSQPLHVQRGPPQKWFSTINGLRYDAVLDFTQPTTIDKVDRLDDAIMGGVSTSSVQPGNGYAIWAGVCRTDGGGFCGFRTNPFETPLMVSANATGLYVEMKLVSDDEPERRIWKMTTRTRPDRGEQLYQSPLYWNSSISADFNRLIVPFEEFQLVRGARRILGGPPLNYTAGLYQLGMSMSKFAWGGDLENFREGVFQVHIKEIGIYYSTKDEVNALESSKPGILSKEATKRKQPLFVKMLLPALQVIFFSEARYVIFFHVCFFPHAIGIIKPTTQVCIPTYTKAMEIVSTWNMALESSTTSTCTRNTERSGWLGQYLFSRRKSVVR